MMRKAAFALALLTALGIGMLLGPLPWTTDTGPAEPAGSEPAEAEREILYWVAPMDPDYRRDRPGKSPMGMDLVPVYADEGGAAGRVRIDPAVRASLGVRTAAAQRGPLPRRIDTVGYVGFDEETIQHVHTRVDGWVESLAVTASGDPVTGGEVLFELYAPALVNAQREFLAAVAGGNAALLDASRERLAALGMNAAAIDRLERQRQVSQRVPYRAESDGVVVHLGVREGIYVTPDTEVLAVARLDPVWVVAEVLERQAGWVEPGQRATARLQALPGEALETVVDYVYPELDPVSRTLRVRLRLDNPRQRLRPNMYANVTIEGRTTPPLVHVPRAAVIRSGDGPRVVVQEDDEHFVVRQVRLGIESGDRIVIREGLRAGERVVVSGQFLIDSEASVDSALQRLDATDAEQPGHPAHGAGHTAGSGEP